MYKLGWFGELGVPKVVNNITIWQSVYYFLFNFNKNYSVYLVPFLSYRELFVKSGQFYPIPTAFGAHPHRGWSFLNLKTYKTLEKCDNMINNSNTVHQCH